MVEHEKVGSRPVELPAPMSKRQRRGEPKPAKMTIEQWHASNDKLVGIEGQVYGKKGYCDGEDFHTGQIIERHTDHVVNVSGSIYYLGVAAPAREHEPGDVATPGAALRQAGMHECHRVADGMPAGRWLGAAEDHLPGAILHRQLASEDSSEDEFEGGAKPTDGITTGGQARPPRLMFFCRAAVCGRAPRWVRGAWLAAWLAA